MIILIDSKIGYGEMDKMLIQSLTTLKIPFITVLTKCDRQPKSEIDLIIKDMIPIHKENSFGKFCD